jgi:hypothetical protein
MPRKSAAALSVIPPSLPKRPEPPAHLSAPEAAIWKVIVACRDHDYFDGASAHLLEAYCGHAHSAHVIAKAIRAADPEDLQRYNKLLGMAPGEQGDYGAVEQAAPGAAVHDPVGQGAGEAAVTEALGVDSVKLDVKVRGIEELKAELARIGSPAVQGKPRDLRPAAVPLHPNERG